MNATLISKNDKRSGIPVWAVTFTDKKGNELMTGWTTFREEACAWGRNIQMTGWTTEGRPGPRL